MRAAWCWTLGCAVWALLAAGLVPIVHGVDRLVLALWAVLMAASARGGMCAIEVATKPPATFSNHEPERRPL